MSNPLSSKLKRAIDYRNEGRYAEARQLFETLLEERPTDAITLYHYACLHDMLGNERGAAPLYERAIALGLPLEELRGALLGLGSTYRTLGAYEQAIERLRQGADLFPDGDEFRVFLAMALYNTGQHREAMEMLLLTLLDTTASPHIRHYERALRFYADKLDQTWS